MHLIDVFGEDVEHATTRSKAIAAPVQIFTTLYYFGQNANVRATGKDGGISAASVSRVIHHVTDAIISRKDEFIKFPSSPREIQKIQQGFHKIAGFPGVVSVVDCTHVDLKGRVSRGI